ncbi:SH3 domain-containing protein [Streptococcus himalayensis]|uniref:N-acetylmuramoyl-L-alanine amidase n=1 Tax=Streptococcus himalayensis TaxID=1888195 RepID=A0A917A330_9STRE|nr:SH3 domain-containing protein [Streptococcus himalayensis]GGE24379.1 hypothetical protein GCM10011510_01870 [Streptococcus himalayensis]
MLQLNVTPTVKKYSLLAASALAAFTLMTSQVSADEIANTSVTSPTEQVSPATPEVATPVANLVESKSETLEAALLETSVASSTDDRSAIQTEKTDTKTEEQTVSIAPNTDVHEEKPVAQAFNPETREAALVQAPKLETREANSNNDTTTFRSAGFRSAGVTSQFRGDDYPAYLKNAAPDTIVDPWLMYNRECTSFTAYRLSSANGYQLPAGYGNANTWGHIARNNGIRVDMKPAVGAVAWFDSYVGGAYGAGHVTWVAEVLGNQVRIEEYNYGNPSHHYNTRIIPANAVSGYIHFKDLGGATAPATSSSATQQGGTNTLASSGVYQFTKRSSVKNVPRVSAPELAAYEAGQSVNYDRVMQADGHRWISYVSFSGVRRYVAVEEVQTPAPKPVATTPARVTIPSSGTYQFTGYAGIKAEPRMAAEDLAHYTAGDTVNYDRVLDGDGHQWISYIGYSGARRYIAIN